MIRFFSCSSMRPCPIQGEIILPEHHGFNFGIRKDINGKKWHINGYSGGCAMAVPVADLHPYYYSTTAESMYGNFSQTWKPYRIKIAGQSVKK